MKVESIAEGAFCNTFNLHWAIIGIENQFSFFLRVTVLHRFDYIIEVFVIEHKFYCQRRDLICEIVLLYLALILV